MILFLLSIPRLSSSSFVSFDLSRVGVGVLASNRAEPNPTLQLHGSDPESDSRVARVAGVEFCCCWRRRRRRRRRRRGRGWTRCLKESVPTSSSFLLPTLFISPRTSPLSRHIFFPSFADLSLSRPENENRQPSFSFSATSRPQLSFPFLSSSTLPYPNDTTRSSCLFNFLSHFVLFGSR